MKIAMLTGSYPPDICGVGDYTAKLILALSDAGVDVHLIKDFCWKWWAIFKWRKLLSKRSFDIVHIQYPTAGYRASLIPQLITIFFRSVPIVITLHEYSLLHPLRRLAIRPFFYFAKKIIFTNQFEFDYVTSHFSFCKKKSSIIPLGSHIQLVENDRVHDPFGVIYFGLIRPNRGLESFIQLVAESQKAGIIFNYRIIGAVPEKFKGYYEEMIRNTAALPIEWKINLPLDDVQTVLSDNTFAYLPYPDGVSERRSSLFTVLAAGLIVVTTEGKATTQEMRDSVLIAHNEIEVLKSLQKFVGDKAELEKLQVKAQNLLKRHDWSSIAIDHQKLYYSLSQNQANK